MTDTEKETLERRIDELCAENEKLRADQAHWELDNCPQCPNIVSVQEALEQNAKLREYTTKLEAANLDVTARLTDYIGQYDPTDAFVAEVKAENAKLIIKLNVEHIVRQNVEVENAKLRKLCHDLREEYAYLRARPRRFYVQHEARMVAIDARMRELGIGEEKEDGVEA